MEKEAKKQQRNVSLKAESANFCAKREREKNDQKLQLRESNQRLLRVHVRTMFRSR